MVAGWRSDTGDPIFCPQGPTALRVWPDSTVRAIGVGLEAALRLTGRRDVKLTATQRPDGAVYHAEWR